MASHIYAVTTKWRVEEFRQKVEKERGGCGSISRYVPSFVKCLK